MCVRSGAKKGFHDLDLLKEHLRAQKCISAKKFDYLTFIIESLAEESDHKLLDTSKFAYHPCNMGLTLCSVCIFIWLVAGTTFLMMFASILQFLARKGWFTLTNIGVHP